MKISNGYSLRLYLSFVAMVLILSNVEGRKYKISKRFVCGTSPGALLKSVVMISESACIDECGRRPSCKALDYSGRLKLCKLYSREDIKLVKGQCVYLKRTDMTVKSTCDETCKKGQVCEKSTNECDISECPPLTGVNVLFRGDLNDIGSIKIVVCNNQFGVSHTTNPTIECQANGTWSRALSCGEPYNVALGKNVTLSTIWGQSTTAGNLMVNGDTSGVWYCACTLYEPSPWALIDLGENHMISSFQIYNRRVCCHGRLHDLEIYVGSLNDSLYFCIKHLGFLDHVLQKIELTRTCFGRYVKLQIVDGHGWPGDLSNGNMLTICELQIYGTPFYG